MLTAKTEMRIISTIGYKPTVAKALHVLSVANGVLLNRRDEQMELSVQKELFRSQAYTIKRDYSELL